MCADSVPASCRPTRRVITWLELLKLIKRFTNYQKIYICCSIDAKSSCFRVFLLECPDFSECENVVLMSLCKLL